MTNERAGSNPATNVAAKSLAAVIALAAVTGLFRPPPAAAAPPAIQIPAEDAFESGEGTPNTGPFGFLNGVSRSGFLLGDMWGLRSTLAKYGISFALQETSEVLGNVTGGAKRGAAYDGLTQMAVQLDTNRAFGWHGGTFNVSALQLHGSNLSSSNLLTLQTASGIEADRATRLWELWYQQKFLEEDRLDIKVGQQSLDQEFMVNPNGAYLINTMFGWPMVPSVDFPRRRPGLSAVGAWRASPLPPDRFRHLPDRGFQRQSIAQRRPVLLGRSAATESRRGRAFP